MSEDNQPLKSALHKYHVAAGAKFTDVAGWEAPLSYGSPLDEVRNAHQRAGLFDISHLGRIRIRADGAMDLLERVCSADVAHQEDDTALYTLICNESGGIIADGWLVRAENFWLLTINACNRVKVLEHLQTHVADLDVKIDDQTRRTTHLWVVGSGARSILDAVLPVKPSSLERCAVKIGSLMVARYIAMRVGYSNLWSIEVVVPNMIAAQGWSFITQKAGDNCVAPAGLAARDVLRIEAGLPRYGHELNETIDPITAGLERAVDFNHDFIGAPAIAKIKQRGAPRTRVGLVLYPQDDPQEIVIPTQGAPVCRTDEREVGSVTSGTFSPTLNRAIALGYTTPDSAVEGTELLVRVNSQTHPAVVTKLK